MRIFVNGKEAIIKKGSSFEFISENRMFTGADAYTLSITFPLRGCERNIEIFGNIHRKDTTLRKKILDCQIIDKNIKLYGSITILEIDNEEVKTQFLQGKSSSNFYSSLDEIYINELDLGESSAKSTQFRPYQCLKSVDDIDSEGWVCFQWVNNTSGNVQNEWMDKYNWKRNDEFYLSIQYYLLWFAKHIAEAVGFQYDFTEWEKSDLKNLVVANTLPTAWSYRSISAVLPHWSVQEFYEEIEKLLNAEIDIDEKGKTIKFKFSNAVLQSLDTVEIADVVDEFTSEYKENKKFEYKEHQNIAYADAGHNKSTSYSSSWFIEQMKHENKLRNYNLFEVIWNLANDFKYDPNYHNGFSDFLTYARDKDTYFIMKAVAMIGDNAFLRLEPVNIFGPLIRDEARQEDIDIELRIIPAWIDSAVDNMLFLECGEFGEKVDDEFAQPYAASILSRGESAKKEQYYDKIYVGFWDGVQRDQRAAYPWVDKIHIRPNMVGWTEYPYSLRLINNSTPAVREQIYSIEENTKYTFKFLNNKIPNVRNIFLIKGKKYVCAKITATFTENGMSQLLKGEFYRVI